MCGVSGVVIFLFSSRRRHMRLVSDWSSDVCSSDLALGTAPATDQSIATQTMTFIAKWVYEDGFHMPNTTPVTTLDGVRPKGEKAVVEFDPNRIVRSEERRVGKDAGSGGAV